MASKKVPIGIEGAKSIRRRQDSNLRAVGSSIQEIDIHVSLLLPERSQPHAFWIHTSESNGLAIHRLSHSATFPR